MEHVYFIYNISVNNKHNRTNDQWRSQELVPGGAHAKVTGFLQEATVDI